LSQDLNFTHIYNHDCIFTDQTYTTNINEIQNAPLFSTQKQNIATKTKSLKKDVDIDISPNPTDGFFKFRFKNKEDEKWNFMIFDMMGKLVKTTTPLNASNEYCLRKPGIYIVKILDKNKLVKIKKLIVK